MSSIDSFTAAFDGLRQSYESGRAAHGYLILGSPRGNAMALAEAYLQLLFCTGKEPPCGVCAECIKVREHTHPDILWIQPESKSRKINIEQIREQLNPRIAQTSYCGGWKAGVLIHADRMTDQAANAFLKTLEEPPGKTVLLLLTDAAQYLLPTIVSRCQRVILASTGEMEEGEWLEPLLEMLRLGSVHDSLESLMQAGLLKGILDEIKKKVTAQAEAELQQVEEDEEVRNARIASRVLDARSRMMRCILLWKRDVLLSVLGVDDSYLHFGGEGAVIHKQASATNYADALRELRAVEAMIRRMERNLPVEAVFEVGLGSALG